MDDSSSSASPHDSSPRFKSITLPCEYIEDYRPGGYHPTELDDLFKNGQYKILRKLGEGSYSTVWLARDLKNNTYVAVKILCSKLKAPVPELQILQHIALAGDTSRYVTRLLDEFIHQGPNGVHNCLVFEPMGPSVNAMVEELPQFKPYKCGMTVRYPFWMAKSILKQSLEALAFLHERGVAHGDFQPGNLLFSLDNIDSEPEDVLRQCEDVKNRLISPAVERIDGTKDASAPRYLCVAQPLATSKPYNSSFKIKLSDMGGAYPFANPPAKMMTPRGLRSPELVLAGDVEKSLDIWSFGCLVFELITGEPLFCVSYSLFEDDDLLLQISERLGNLPDNLFVLWKNSHLYFTPEKKLFNYRVGFPSAKQEPYLPELQTMEEMFDEANTGLDEGEAQMVKTLIRQILQYDPSKRPTPEELLHHPFFS